jgi:hypothetical protein
MDAAATSQRRVVHIANGYSGRAFRNLKLAVGKSIA